MTEKLIRALADISGISSNLRLYPRGGASLYPEESSVKTDISGNRAVTLKIRARFKGSDASRVFSAAESAYSAFSAAGSREKLAGKGVSVSSLTADPPYIESCDNSGMYVVSFAAYVSYTENADSGGGISGNGGSDGHGFTSVGYDRGDGNIIFFPYGGIYVEKTEGTEPFSSVFTTENAFYDGAEYISSRTKARKIILTLRINSQSGEERRSLYSLFRTGSRGTLCFRCGGELRKINCIPEKITGDIKDDCQLFRTELICPSPFFERAESVYSPLCGICDLLEFDGLELPEKDEFEFSGIISRNSTLVINGGDVPAGCVISVKVERPEASGIKVTRTDTKEYVSVNGVFSYGDEVIFDTRDGSKSISLKRGVAPAEDITARIVWGSQFFRIPAGSCRIRIEADGGTDGISAAASFTERFEGI